MPDFPEQFPGAWQNFPKAVKRMLAKRLVDKCLSLHGGPDGLVRFIYAGTARPGMSVAESYRFRGPDLWPFVVEDTKLLLAQEQEKKANPSGDAPT